MKWAWKISVKVSVCVHHENKKIFADQCYWLPVADNKSIKTLKNGNIWIHLRKVNENLKNINAQFLSSFVQRNNWRISQKLFKKFVWQHRQGTCYFETRAKQKTTVTITHGYFFWKVKDMVHDCIIFPELVN